MTLEINAAAKIHKKRAGPYSWDVYDETGDRVLRAVSLSIADDVVAALKTICRAKRVCQLVDETLKKGLPKMKTYVCSAVWPNHEFSANADPERVPQAFGSFVCKEHLPEVNDCRRKKGLEPIPFWPDSYDERG